MANIHVVNPDIIVHTVVTGEMDHDHAASMMIPLGECSDEQLLAEVARRKLDLHDKITDSVVRETYDFGKVGSRYEYTHLVVGRSILNIIKATLTTLSTHHSYYLYYLQ